MRYLRPRAQVVAHIGLLAVSLAVAADLAGGVLEARPAAKTRRGASWGCWR